MEHIRGARLKRFVACLRHDVTAMRCAGPLILPVVQTSRLALVRGGLHSPRAAIAEAFRSDGPERDRIAEPLKSVVSRWALSDFGRHAIVNRLRHQNLVGCSSGLGA